MGSASYTKGAKRAGGNHEWVGMNHEIHEIHEREIQNHEWTRMDTKRVGMEPRMDTNGAKGKFRTTNGHEWREGEIQSHEWTRMGTNGKFRATNGHEWTRMEPRNTGVEPRNTRKTRKKAGGIV